jgi:hypothetical protein
MDEFTTPPASLTFPMYALTCTDTHIHTYIGLYTLLKRYIQRSALITNTVIASFWL